MRTTSTSTSVRGRSTTGASARRWRAARSGTSSRRSRRPAQRELLSTGVGRVGPPMGSRRGEPGDQHAEGIAPEPLRGRCERRAAQLDRRQSLAESVELERCFTDAALTDEARRGEQLDALMSTARALEAAERKWGHASGSVRWSRLRRVPGVRAQAPEHQRCIGQVDAWIVLTGSASRPSSRSSNAQAPSAPRSPSFEPKRAVDGPRRRAGVARELAKRQSTEPCSSIVRSAVSSSADAVRSLCSLGRPIRLTA